MEENFVNLKIPAPNNFILPSHKSEIKSMLGTTAQDLGVGWGWRREPETPNKGLVLEETAQGPPGNLW